MKELKDKVYSVIKTSSSLDVVDIAIIVGSDTDTIRKIVKGLEQERKIEKIYLGLTMRYKAV